jgi:hypothetical protein
MKGWVLVFDLDETIIGHTPKDDNPTPWNNSILDILSAAAIKREEGKVDSILLLTNNGNAEFIDQIDNHLGFICLDNQKDKFFDKIYDMVKVGDVLRSPKRAGREYKKALVDVENMLDDIEHSKEDLSERVLFFDDLPHHELSLEIPSKNYITIVPPFTGVESDELMKQNRKFPHVYEILEMDVPVKTVSERRRKTPRKKERKRRRTTRRK